MAAHALRGRTWHDIKSPSANPRPMVAAAGIERTLSNFTMSLFVFMQADARMIPPLEISTERFFWGIWGATALAWTRSGPAQSNAPARLEVCYIPSSHCDCPKRQVRGRSDTDTMKFFILPQRIN